MAKKNLKIKSSQNKSPVVETREPDHQVAIEYIDKLMQRAPGSRMEHVTGQQALAQLARAIQRLKEQPTLLKMDKEVEQRDKTIEKLQKQIDKLKGQ